MSESEPLEHIKADQPDELETHFQMYWCRRCGRALETFDGRELAGKAKPCRVVHIDLREALASTFLGDGGLQESVGNQSVSVEATEGTVLRSSTDAPLQINDGAL